MLMMCLSALLPRTPQHQTPSAIRQAIAARHFLCANIHGRLGNQMFQYASVFGISRLKNMSMRVSRSDRVSRYFTISAQQFDGSNFCDYTNLKIEAQSCAFDPEMVDISSFINWKLINYLQSWKYFYHVADELRKEFTFQQPLKAIASRIFLNAVKDKRCFQRGATYVGVHVRRGDMATFAVRRNGTNVPLYNVAPRQYILNAMQYYLQRYRCVVFVLVSDEMSWVRAQLGRHADLLNLVLVHTRHAALDMAILTLTNHTIMTTGTFGWWAAWLTGGTVTYYTHFVLDSSPLRPQFSKDFKDYYYPGWIPME